jgi:3',5'-cyclic AMP phosphodiesterase CpdA
MKLLAHISDLHFGRTDPVVVEGLLQDLKEEHPHLIIVSGDLTQAAKPTEFEAARAFLDRLPAPYLVIPGNHDVPPVNILERFIAPFARYRHYISKDMAPHRIEDDFAIIGINTARRFRWRWNWALGSISNAQIIMVRDFFTPLSPGLFKILVTHHPFLPPPDTPKEDLAAHAAEAIPVFEECGVDLILSGHLHRAYQGEIEGHQRAMHRSILVAQASTATSTRTRREPNAYNSIILQEKRVGLRVRSWKDGKFVPLQTAWFAKEDGRWVALSPAAEATPEV